MKKRLNKRQAKKLAKFAQIHVDANKCTYFDELKAYVYAYYNNRSAKRLLKT